MAKAKNQTVKTLSEPIILINTEMTDPEVYEFCGGTICCYADRRVGAKTNGDSLAIAPFTSDSGVLLIADGAGGTPGGNRASGVAIEKVIEQLPGKKTSKPLRDCILDGFEIANETILGEKSGAATTLFVLEVQKKKIRPYHVGDSLILVVGQRGKKKLQTVFHSPEGYAIESGIVDESELLPEHASQEVINFVGDPYMRIELGSPLDLDPNDTVLLASDGLTDNLTISEITEMIRKGPLDETARALRDLAKKRMENPVDGFPSKPDDLSFILFRLS